MLKQLTLGDLVPFLDDNQLVDITAYNIPLYNGAVRTIPAIYTPYVIVKKLYTVDDCLKIDLDC